MLPYVKFAINNSREAATKVSPCFLNYGFNPRTPVTLDIARLTDNADMQLLSDALSNLDELLVRVRSHLHASQDTDALYANKKRAPHIVNASTYVLLKTTILKFTGKAKGKLLPRFVVPFHVQKMVIECGKAWPASWMDNPPCVSCFTVEELEK